MAINYPQRYDDDFLNTIKTVIDHVNAHGKTIQDLVAEGQLTEAQYSELLRTINGLISKGNVTFNDIDINKGKLLPKHLSEEILRMLTGDAPVNSVPADGSLTTQKYANDSVTIEKLEGFMGVAFVNNAFGYKVDFDFENERITIPKYSYITVGSNRLAYLSKDQVVLPFPQTGVEGRLIFDLTSNSFKATSSDDADTKKSLIIANWWLNTNLPNTLFCQSPHTVNGEETTVYKQEIKDVYKAIDNATTDIPLSKLNKHGNIALVGNVNNLPLDFDFKNFKITIPGGTYLTGGDRRIHYNGSAEGDIIVDFSHVEGQLGERHFIYDLNDNSFKVKRSSESATKNSLLIATWFRETYPDSISCLSKYTINGKKVDSYNRELDDYVLHSQLGSDSFIFDENEHYPLYKSPIYLTEKAKLQFFFDSIFVSVGDNSLKKLNPLLTYNDDIGSPIFNKGLSPVISGTDFSGETLSIRYNNGELKKHYQLEKSVMYKKHDEITNTSPKVIMIGDSLTQHGTPTYTESALQSIGLTPQMMGTFYDYNQTPSEGRGSWTWTNYIGRNSRLGINDITITQETGNTSTRTTNPFWKIATETDKQNYPEWCFEYNELEENNPNYTESTNKETATFHIFDMEYYIGKLNGETPDVVTIGLGGNDLTLESRWNKDVYELMELSLEIMVKQIRKALPSTPIIIIPLSSRGGFEDDNWNPVDNKYVKWYDRCADKLNEINDTNTHLLSMFAHMSRDYIWDTTITELPNGIIKNEDSDTTHFGELGLKQYGEVLASCIVNVT